MSRKLTDCEQRVLAAVKRGAASFTKEEIHFAIQSALHEADLSSYHSLELTSALAMTANVPEIDVSSLTTMRPERVTRAFLSFTDRSTWAAAASYAFNDIVQGDGSPNSYYYTCKEAHTSSASNEPGTTGGDTYWVRRLWKRGDEIEIRDFKSIAHMLGDRPLFRLYLPTDYIFTDLSDGDNSGVPRVGAFMTQGIFVVYPPPDAAYKVTFLMQQAVTAWVPGTESDVDIDVPDNVLLPLLFYGAAYFLMPGTDEAQGRLASFRRHIQLIAGQTNVDAGIGYKDETAFPGGIIATDRLGYPYYGR